MKKTTYIIFLSSVMLLAACSEDKFTESIFDTDIPVVDNNAATAPFDQWIYDNFTVPYNVEIQYRLNFPATNLNFQLTPSEYKRSQVLTHFIKFLFYDVYTLYAGDDFMKQYGPRIFHFIGSSGYSPTTGTEVLGTASGGVKITLYKINDMKAYEPGVVFTPADLEKLNEDYFHTMHHEFSHILHQTKSYPVNFGQITSNSYDPINWQDRDSTETHRLGYVTHYASSATYEDFVETLSCIITDTECRWMNRIIDACLTGVRIGDKEQIVDLIENKLQLENVDSSTDAPWNKVVLYDESLYNEMTGEYEETGNLVMECYRDLETEVVNKEVTKYVKKYKYAKNKEFKTAKTFREFLDWVPVTSDEDLAGINVIMKKIDIANKWYSEKWGLDAFVIRHEVSRRQLDVTRYLSEDVIIYDYQ